MRSAIWVLWPSFIVGGIAETVFFTFIDPMELPRFDETSGISRLAVYSGGFFVFWAIAAASSAFTCFLQRSANQIERSTAPPRDRAHVDSKKENSHAPH